MDRWTKPRIELLCATKQVRLNKDASDLSDSVRFVRFAGLDLSICQICRFPRFKKKQETDGRTDRQTDQRTDPLIEMRGRI